MEFLNTLVLIAGLLVVLYLIGAMKPIRSMFDVANRGVETYTQVVDRGLEYVSIKSEAEHTRKMGSLYQKVEADTTVFADAKDIKALIAKKKAENSVNKVEA